MMFKAVVFVTIVFMFAGSEIRMTTTVDTMEKCEEIIQSITASVGEENVSVGTCEEKYEVSE